MRRLTGIGVSGGTAIGPALLMTARASDVRFLIGAEEVDRQLARLAAAIAVSRRQLQEIKAKITVTAGAETAHLFDAQILMLDDPMLGARAAGLIRSERINPEWALQRACDELASVFDEVEDQYLRERKGDVADVVGRLRLNLRGGTPGASAALFQDLEEPHILVADQLLPSTAAQIDWTRVLAFATEGGSWTHHTAILARSLGVPAVAGVRGISQLVRPGAVVAIDGTAGEVTLDPPASVTSTPRRARPARWRATLPGPVSTADGVRIHFSANLDVAGEAADARRCGAEGVGLARSEFLLGGGGSVMTVSEAAQFEAYRALLVEMIPDPVTIRTFDLSEDQSELSDGTPGHGRGLRGLRLCLAQPELFQRQLRALLRAAHYGRLRILFPFLSGLQEWRQARAVLDRVAMEMRAAGEPVGEFTVGAMIEVPSAVLTADLLAREAQFMSIGTNDLIEYTLAVDRSDGRLSGVYDPLHPAVLRAIRMTVRAARTRDVPVSVAGEMATDPVALAVLIGLGVREFSMRPAAIAAISERVGYWRVAELQTLAARLLRGGEPVDVQAYVEARPKRQFALDE